ncbi:MAG: sulfatase [Candidatus Omnitrophica bacterium]|nr:sulfatase [Candidatus Omnitrophota bacterium]
MTRKNRLFSGITAAVFVPPLILWLLYFTLGHKAVDVVYGGQGPAWARNLIIDHDLHPPEYYYALADDEMLKIIALAFCALFFIWLICAFILHRKVFIVTGLTGLAVLLRLNFTLDRGGDYRDFALRLEQKSARSGDIVKRARAFNEQGILRALADSRRGGFCFRFDERLYEADVDTRYKPLDTGEHCVRFDFEDEEGVFSVRDGNLSVVNGALLLENKGEVLLANQKPLDIDPRNLGEVVIRMKTENSRNFLVYWSGVEAKTRDKLSRNITLIPDGQFHTYRINAQTDILPSMGSGEKIKNIFLKFPAPHKESILIDYIYFLDKQSHYNNACGVTYIQIGNQMRPAVYMHPLSELKYSLTLPEERVVLSFGLGVLQGESPVDFAIKVKDEENIAEIFSTRAANVDAWGDYSLDLSAWRGKPVEVSFITGDNDENVLFLSSPALLSSPANKLNVIIFLEDALRADHLSCYGYARDTSPFLSEFSGAGAIFLNAFSQAPNTRASCASLMTSLYPSATGAWYFPLDNAYLTLPEIMRAGGFVTASFSQSPKAGPYGGLHQGFDYMFEIQRQGAGEEGFYNDLYRWIADNRDSNFFLYVHLLDPHSPYDAPEPFRDWYEQDARTGEPVDMCDIYDPPWVQRATKEGRIALYDGEIRHNDDIFRRFIEDLAQLNLLDDSLIIFMSDHGEFFGEHGQWHHHPPLYKEVLHIPLIMAYPKGIAAGKRIYDNVQIVDIMPTILDMAGIEREGLLLYGESLLPLLAAPSAQHVRMGISYADEVSSKIDSEIARDASGGLFYGAHHILSSSLFQPLKAKLIRLPLDVFWTKIFDLNHNPSENAPLMSYFSDLILKFKFARFVSTIKSNNVEIKNNIIKGNFTENIYDEDLSRQLRSLGYTQ